MPVIKTKINYINVLKCDDTLNSFPISHAPNNDVVKLYSDTFTTHGSSINADANRLFITARFIQSIQFLYFNIPTPRCGFFIEYKHDIKYYSLNIHKDNCIAHNIQFSSLTELVKHINGVISNDTTN